jgi:hypothetical protein
VAAPGEDASWRDQDSDLEFVLLCIQVVFDSARVMDSAIRVIYEAEKRAAVWVPLVFRNIYDELLAQLSGTESWP